MRENSLDVIFVACRAPGQSAYYAVERRMVPLQTLCSLFPKPGGDEIVHKQPCNQPVEDDEPAEATDTISSDALVTVSDANDGLPVVCNLFDWLQSAFVETD